MEALLVLAYQHQLRIVEEGTQAVGAVYTFANRTVRKIGTLGHASTVSFSAFASLGGPATGGVVLTNNDTLAQELRALLNSNRLPAEQSAVYSGSDVSTAVLSYTHMQQVYQANLMRLLAAVTYDDLLLEIPGVQTPVGVPYSTHVFQDYALVITRGRRDGLARFLREKGVDLQETRYLLSVDGDTESYPVAKSVASSVLLLPIHSATDRSAQEVLCSLIDEYMSEHEFVPADFGQFC